jgi:hypothetical protein
MRNQSLESLEARRLLASTAFASVEPAPPTTGTAIVRGNVFRDANQNAVRDAGEVGQPNIRVFLDYNGNGVRDGDAEPIQITNSLGAYRFETAKAPATITLRLLLAGTNLIQTLPVESGARQVTTTVGGNFEVGGFGVFEPAVPPPAFTLVTGIVYTDRNGNGMRDGTEAGRPNVSVYIDTNRSGGRDDGEPVAVTNGEGRYTFEHVAAGEKQLRLLLAGTHLQQTQPSNNGPVVVNVITTQAIQAAPFGVMEIPVIPPTPSAVITGNVFYDRNENAIRDPNESGRAMVRVYIDLDNDKIRDTNEPMVFTNLLGRYRFERAPVSPELHIRLDLAGTHLRQTLPLNDGARVLATVAGQTYVDQNFGVVEITVPPPAFGQIRGRVFNDLDHDGIADQGEAGVPNKIVYLDLDHSGALTDNEPRVATDLEGRYTFEHVPVGTYAVRLIRGEWIQTSPPENGAHVAVVTAGAIVGDKHFGIYRTPVTPTILGEGGRLSPKAKDEWSAAALVG